MIINKTLKQKLFHIEKINFTSSPPPPYPHPLTTTNHSQKKKKKNPPPSPPPPTHHKPHPSKTKSQTHQINQPTPISQSHPNQLIPMTIKPLKAAETHPQPRSNFTKATHSYPRLKACDGSGKAILKSRWGEPIRWAKTILKSARFTMAPARKIVGDEEHRGRQRA